jgi:TolB-like protein/Tfp pilus assembly protein PilF
VQNKIAWGLAKLGTGELKHIAIPVAIYRVTLPWLSRRNGLADRLAFFAAKKSVRRLLAAGAVVVALGGLALWFHASRQAAPINRLAVLPLVNFSGKPDEEFFADGMTEELISTLAAIRDLNVIARTSVTKFKGARLDIREIGAALMVGSVLEGSVRLNGDMARINVSLVDVRTQKTVWSEEFNQTLRDVLAVQSAIARRVTEALRVQLVAGENARLDRPGPASSPAYREYLEGRSHLSHRTSEDITAAIANFTRALEEDASFAPACAGLAECYTLAGVAGYASLPRTAAIEQARYYAQRAVTLDDSSAEAHAALAYMRFRVDWDWPGAETEFRRALELKPGVAHTHELFGLFLALQKRPAEAMVEMRRAAQLDPLSPSVSNGVGRLLHFQGKFDDAIAQFRRTMGLDPTYAEAPFSLGLTYAVLGRHADAIAAFDQALPLSSNRQVMLVMRAVEQGRAGRIEETRQLYDEFHAEAQRTPVSPYFLGILAYGLGRLDEAMDYFERAADERDGILVYLPVDPIAADIWAHPRFPNLLRRMGLRP